MSDDDQKFGLEGVEQSQGYESMPVASPVDMPEPEMTEGELQHFKRPEPPAPIEREYRDHGGTGEEIDKKYTVSAEQAAHDIGNARKAERQALEAERNRQLDEALAAHEAGQGERHSAADLQTSASEQPPVDGVQPEQMDTDHTQAAAQDGESPDPYADADRQITEMLAQPLVRERIEGEFNQVRAQAAETVHAAQTRYDAAISQLSQEIGVVTAALVPEIAGMNAEQARGALAVLARTNPARAEQIAQFANRIQGAVNLTQQQQHRQQQQQSQIAEFQQRQAAEAFQAYAAEQDAKALAGETPESISAIRKTIFADAKAAGVSEKDLYQAYNTIPALRHSFVQGLMADGAKWRASQRSLASHRANPIPKVQRPGSSAETRSDNSEYASLERSFRGKDLSAKQAADLLIAHRARSR